MSVVLTKFLVILCSGIIHGKAQPFISGLAALLHVTLIGVLRVGDVMNSVSALT